MSCSRISAQINYIATIIDVDGMCDFAAVGAEGAVGPTGSGAGGCTIFMALDLRLRYIHRQGGLHVRPPEV
jgi:galactokinase